MRISICYAVAVIAAAALHSVPAQAQGELIHKRYEGFEILIDCSRRAPILFQYTAAKDTGNHPRVEEFSLDPSVPERCQQKTPSTYRSPGQRYDRGHMVASNHLDHSISAMTQSNYMTNVLPQAANMNRGAWYETEVITECYRDLGQVRVIGGPVWGSSRDHDYFLESHGVQTPAAFWKVLIHKGRVIAWLIPNSQDATKAKLDSYLISIEQLERVTGITIPIDSALKARPEQASWSIPSGCNLG